jgi:hypothetical protein
VIPDLFKMGEFWTFLTAFVFSQVFWAWVIASPTPLPDEPRGSAPQDIFPGNLEEQ